MNANETCFVKLIRSHLNNTVPPVFDSTDYKEILRLAAINNVVGIIAAEIGKADETLKLPDEQMSFAKQQLGYTLIDYDEKCALVKNASEIFDSIGADYLFVKGTVIREYYPQKELRTSGDVDIIIRQKDIKRVCNALSDNGYRLTEDKGTYISFDYGNQHIEIHSDENYDNPYFKDIFSLCEKTGNGCILSDELHLLYVLCHIAKHFNMCGAGIRMFIDIDVLIRHIGDFDYDGFIAECEKAGIATLAKAAFSLCNYWFDTPVKAEIDFNKNEAFRKLFEAEIINGGSFGFESRGLSDYYLNKGMGDEGRVDAKAKAGALMHMLFPPKRYLYNQFRYAQEHHILLPAAWANRLFNGVFRHGRNSAKTLDGIINRSSTESEYKKLLKELEL
jgi:hypothetical protein